MERGKFTFVLSSFGLQNLKPMVISPGTGLTQLTGDAAAQFNVLDITQAEKIKDSALGTPIFDNVILADNLDQPELKLEIDTVLIDAELPKLIKKTQVLGRQGRIKEYIADDDWRITLRGALFSDVKDAYPSDQVQTLRDLARLSTSLQVASTFINDLLGVDTIVVERLQLRQRSGMMSAQAFQLTCSSDLPYEISKEVDNE